MSNITLFKGGVPSYLKGAELDETTKSLMGSAGGGKRISIKGGVFRMIAGGEEVAVNEDRAMNIIIVKAAAHNGRSYYEGTYKEGENAAPVCWSTDGVKPAPEAPKKHCDTCAKCEQNIKGSGQGDSRACRFSRKLAVVLDGDLEGDVYELSLPATSIFPDPEGGKMPLNAYVKALAAHNVPVTAVVTEMRFDTKSPTPKLFFSPVRPLEEAEWLVCKEQGESTAALDAVKMTFSVKTKDKDDEEFESKIKKAEKKAAKPEPVEESEEVVEEEVPTPEPKKVEKKAAKPEPVEESENLDDLIAEWADDEEE